MKKQASPVPTPRAAALSQSASRYAAGATSAWQNIANNSARLANATRRPNTAGRTLFASGQAAPPEDTNRRLTVTTRTTLTPEHRPQSAETIRQVGWRDAERAVSVRTKRKYSLFGLEFGPKKAVFETEKVKLPVYQETDRHKRYYAAVRQEDVARIRREGFSAEPGAKKAPLPQSVKQFNTQGRIRFFTNTANAQAYGKATIADGYAIVEFVLPEFQEFTADVEADAPATKPSNLQSMQMLSTVPSACIKSIKEQ